MFGDHVPNNSPHLRKSGSRSVVFDIGTNELGNSAEEDFLHSTVSNVMKGMSSPLPSVAIMPSPVLLWRFKVLLFFIWVFICCKIGWDFVMRMSEDLRDLFLYEAFLYYNPFLLMFAGCIKNQYYTQSQYDEVRSEWSEFVYSYVGA
ncbi:uncharacterized protein LOC142517625 isoform X3 [Primulina tabacum]|uniref:uncharacterized protein LOC142517625 isoform X3 n=1 Tax=Primulina tabacum TaxID=48773 RepID=UPI003F5A5B73